MSATVQVRSRGVLTLPASLRDKYNIQAGDTYQLLDLDGIFLLTPMVPLVPEPAREIEMASPQPASDVRLVPPHKDPEALAKAQVLADTVRAELAGLESTTKPDEFLTSRMGG